MAVFEAAHFAGVDDMRASDRLYQRVAPLCIADILLAIGYVAPPATRPPLPCPIVALDGERDDTIVKGNMAVWEEYTSSSFSRSFIDGDHYFVAARYRDVVRLVSDALLDMTDGAVEGGLLGADHSWTAGT